jgi:hypothetical protein
MTFKPLSSSPLPYFSSLPGPPVTDHPITPPPELVKQWDMEALTVDMPDQVYLATQAARWGSDIELEACINYADTHVSGNCARALREIRRPKPPSPKEQALAELNHLITLIPSEGALAMAERIRVALEALPE